MAWSTFRSLAASWTVIGAIPPNLAFKKIFRSICWAISWLKRISQCLIIDGLPEALITANKEKLVDFQYIGNIKRTCK